MGQLHLTDKGAILQEGQAAALSALQRKENKKFQEVECLIFNRRLGPVSLGTQDIDEDWIWQLDFDGIIKRLGLSKLDSQLDNLVFLRRKGERKITLTHLTKPQIPIDLLQVSSCLVL